MAHIATKHTETHLFELHYNNGFELLTCTSGKKPEVRALTIGEAFDFWKRSTHRHTCQFHAVPRSEKWRYLELSNGRKVEIRNEKGEFVMPELQLVPANPNEGRGVLDFANEKAKP